MNISCWKALLLVGVGIALCGVIAVQRLHLAEADAAITGLEHDLKDWKEAAARWEAVAKKAQEGEAALYAQAQSCLDREAEARADADAWKALLDGATLRDMTPREEKGVPDNATRKILLDALDRPL